MIALLLGCEAEVGDSDLPADSDGETDIVGEVVSPVWSVVMPNAVSQATCPQAVGNDVDSRGCQLVGIDRWTGAERWRTNSDIFSNGGDEPTSPDRSRLVVRVHGGIAAVLTSDGGRDWTWPVDDDTWHTLGGAPSGAVVVTQVERDGPTRMVSLDWTSGAPVWEGAGPDGLYSLGSSYGTMAPDGRTMLVGHSDGYFAVDVDSGTVIGTYRAAPVGAGDHGLVAAPMCPLLLLPDGVVAVTTYGVTMMPYLDGLGPDGQTP